MPIFFIVGAAKSGTSWLMKLLDDHPEIRCGGEGRFFGTPDPDRPTGAISMQQALRDSLGFGEWISRSSWMRGEPRERVGDRLSAAYARWVLDSESAASGKRIAGDKTPLLSCNVVAETARILPEAKVIHIVRDGRDVVVSAVHHRWNNAERSGAGLSARQRQVRDEYRADPEAFKRAGRSIFDGWEWPHIGCSWAARQWAERAVAAAEQGLAMGPDRYAEVRYEDLLAAGPAELGRLCAFLGVDPEPALLERLLTRNSFERASGGRRPGEERPDAFLRSGAAGGWREVLTQADLEAFMATGERFRVSGGEALARFGYEADEGLE